MKWVDSFARMKAFGRMSSLFRRLMQFNDTNKLRSEMLEVGTYVDRDVYLSGDVRIGSGCIVQGLSFLRAYGTGKIVIEDGCTIGSKTHIIATQGMTITVGRNSTVHMGSKIEGFCNLGEGCIIGVGSHIDHAHVGKQSILSHCS